MAKHQNLSSPYSVHPFAYTSNADPASDASIDMAPYKGWINTGSSNLLKVRNAATNAWEDVSVAGAATTPAFGSNSNSVATANVGGASTLASRADHVHLGVRSISHTSNTFSGPVTLVAGANIGITSSATGTFRFDGAAGGSGSSDLSGAELDYVQKTSSTNITATTEATADTILTGAAVAYDGTTKVVVEFGATYVNTPANQQITVCLYDGASSIGKIAVQLDQGAAAVYLPMQRSVRITPSAASHTYSIRAFMSGGTGVVTGGAGGNGNEYPCFMRITRV